MAHISIAQTSKMCHRVGTALNAGVDVMKVLQREAGHGSTAYRHNMNHVVKKVGSGMTMAEAMRDCHGYFSPLTCELVGVGEETGRLETVLLTLAEHYQHMIKLRRTFLLGILWPALQLFGAIFVIGGLIFLLGILGTGVKVFGLAGASGAAIFFVIVAAILVVLAIIGYGLSRGWFGPLPGRLLMLVPGIGNAIKTMALARLSWTLAMALEAGIDAGRAMRLALHSTQLHYFIRHCDDVDASIQRGRQFHEALEDTGAFPVDFLTSLQNAELSGTESESLSRMSQEYQRQAQAASTALAVIMSMVIWGLVITLLVVVIIYLFVTLYYRHITEALEMVQ